MEDSMDTSRESQLLPSFTRAWLNFFTLAFTSKRYNRVSHLPRRTGRLRPTLNSYSSRTLPRKNTTYPVKYKQTDQ